MHENDVELPSDEDEEFESTALEFQDKFRQLNGKFQEILMQESTVEIKWLFFCIRSNRVLFTAATPNF